MASGPETGCIDDVVLAAFIEGRLPEGRAREVEAHLDRCSDCYRVFTDATRLLLDESPGALPAPVAPAAGRRRFALLLPVAAALVMAALWVRDAVAPTVGSPIAGDPAALLAEGRDVADLAAASWNADPAARAFVPVEEPGRRAFRAGVLSVDLELARRAGDAARIPALEAAAASLEADRLGDPERYAFGRWVEAGRLLAVVRDLRLHADPRWRQALSRPPAGTDAAASRVAAGIAATLARVPETEADWRRLEEGLRDLVLLM